MLKCATSLWSADLTNLAAEVRAVDEHSERFHLDVADGHYVPTMLFFPDLVKQLRQHTRKPFEIHLMTADPMAWIEPFVESGADGFIFCFDSLADPEAAFEKVKSLGKYAGVSLLVEEPLSVLKPYWPLLDLVTIVGTPMGVKGYPGVHPSVPEKIRAARALVRERGLAIEIEVDGGIRRHTVPALREAGADWIVPGSLMFGEDPAEMRRWLAGL